ncbi:MAG: hypothetical protein ABSA03_17950 [Streptosporangiaceae bacterium]
MPHVTTQTSQPLTSRRGARPARAFPRWLAACAAVLCALAAAVLPAAQAQAAAQAPASAQARAQAATVTWSVAHSPNGSGASTLTDVSCASATRCMAVGFYTDSSDVDQTLAESWNGTSWSLTKIPDKGSSDNILMGVSCASATRCMAVGYHSTGSGAVQILAETWNGSAWSVTSTHNPSSTYDALNGVSCASVKSCMAVGFANIGSNTETVAESWNGSSWTVRTSQNPGGSYTLFGGVSCASTASCVAVGSQFDGVSEDLTLVESWNGSSWSVVPSTPSPGENNFLAGVSCVSSTHCVAVGQAQTADLTTTVIESWNGGSWQLADSSNPGSTSDQLNDVSCAGSKSCVAVGDDTSGGVTDTLIETLSGGSWPATTSPDPSSSYNTLRGVSCTAPGSCAAAGSDAPAATSKTLIEATF